MNLPLRKLDPAEGASADNYEIQHLAPRELPPIAGATHPSGNPSASEEKPRPTAAYVADPIEPWPDPIYLSLLLDELAGVLCRYVVLPEHAAETLALCVLHTYAFELRDISTYIGVESPEKRCGKTTLLGVLSELAHRPVVAANISPSAFFRVIEETRPTLLIDEADTFLQGNEELRGILNSGYHRKTAFVVRVGVERSLETGPAVSRLHRFSCWCPKVIAAIGRLPDTLADRCIVLRMHRRIAGEPCERSRDLDAQKLRRCCVRLVQDQAEIIRASRPQIPPELNDRAADVWEPLLVLADIAGSPWPAKARQAALALSANADQNSPIGALLFDIFVAFALAPNSESGMAGKRLLSRDLVAHLNLALDRPWAEHRNGRPITDLWLAQQLRPYGIRSRSVRVADVTGKGYCFEQFADAFHRYMPKSELDHYKARLADD